MKRTLPVIIFFVLLAPLWLVIFAGYPILLNDPANREQFPGKTNRCFALGDTNKLMSCMRGATPKVRWSFLLVYFHEFRYLFVISGLMLALTSYCGVWLVFKQDSED